MIPVTQPYLPAREKLEKYIDGIYQRKWLTNSGPLVEELTQRLKKYLGVEHLLLVANGTLALQMAYRALGIEKTINGEPAEAITTPFSFVATASTLKWENITPVFCDIDAETWCLDPTCIEASITPQTKAIVPVHVFGNACDVEAIKAIADKYQLKVIYDAAHAFGVKHNGDSLLQWGDAATLSFHATKVFHTIEGGAIIFKDKESLDKAKELINFGIEGPERIVALGINAKMNEFNAAMGLCVLDEIELNLAQRSQIWHNYADNLGELISFQQRNNNINNNYAYVPVVFDTEQKMLQVKDALMVAGIMARRYFYPSLDSLEFLNDKSPCHVSRNISARILCLPIFSALNSECLDLIIKTIKVSYEKNSLSRRSTYTNSAYQICP